MAFKKVLIADDHPVVREGLKQIINKSNDLRVAAEAANGYEVLQKVKKEHYDVLVLDINMPGKDGIDVINDLKINHPNIPILVLSVYPEEQLGIRVLKAGASGYLNKEKAPKELVDAIKRILADGKYVSPTLASQLLDLINSPNPAEPHKILSNREFEVLLLITKGIEVTEIADQLSISVKTVRTYRDRILTKLKLNNVVELTHYAVQQKLI
jgi:two-component system invasion response regulator UvrY